MNPAYLHALEADDYSQLPVPVFTRGFIRAYCQMLGETPEQALALYDGRGEAASAPVTAAALAATTAPGPAAPRTAAALPRPAGEPVSRSRGPVLVSFILLVVLGVALFAVTLALQSGREAPDDRRAGSRPPAPRVADPAPPVAAPPAPTSSSPTIPSAPAPPPATPSNTPGYRLVARTVETTWMRVRTDDKTTEETIPAGQTREWSSPTQFTLTIGNAGGVKLELNGRPLPPLGASGAVIPKLVLPTESQ